MALKCFRIIIIMAWMSIRWMLNNLIWFWTTKKAKCKDDAKRLTILSCWKLLHFYDYYLKVGNEKGCF